MNKYQDRWSRYHHKPCKEGEPSSNNGWIYSAYANKIGLPLDPILLSHCMTGCRIPGNPPHIIRSPNKPLPPQSRDEILGLAALKLLQPGELNGWNFGPYVLPKFNPLKLIQQLWRLLPTYEPTFNYENKLENKLFWKHRNYFWENNLDQIYRFAFSVPLQDRAFILRCGGETNTLRYAFYKAIEFVDLRIGKGSGIKWLKGGKSLEAMQQEFPEDHPFNQIK